MNVAHCAQDLSRILLAVACIVRATQVTTVTNQTGPASPSHLVHHSLPTTNDMPTTNDNREQQPHSTDFFTNETTPAPFLNTLISTTSRKEEHDSKARLLNISRTVCVDTEIIHELNLKSRLPYIITVELSNPRNSLSEICWVYITGPADSALSVLLLEQSCDVPGAVDVSEACCNGSTRSWQSCQRTINPGPDYLSPGNELYVGFGVTSAGFYKAKLNVLVSDPLTERDLHTRYISPMLGYIQNSGVHLHAPYSPRKENKVTYPDNLDMWSHLLIPDQHLIMVSVAIVSLGQLPPDKLCDDYLELTKGREPRQVVWKLCSGPNPLPAPMVIGQHHERQVSVHFVSHSSRETPFDFPLKHGCGFRVVFSFHKKPSIPTQIDDSTWNCSVSYWPEFEAHFRCNLLTECDGGEDEDHCPYTPCANNGVLIAHTCYTMHIADTGITWHHANALCSNLGGRLGAIKSSNIQNVLTRSLRLDLELKSGYYVIVGVRTADTNMFLYRNTFQWTDKIITFRGFISNDEANDFTYFGYLHPFSVGFVVTFFEALSKLQDTCNYHTCKYLCERTMNMNSNKKYDGATAETNPRTGHNVDIRLTPVSTSSIPFPYVQCPAKHVTHSFLAFDVPSRCYEEDTFRTHECAISTDPGSPSCLAELQSLSAPFRCTNGMQTLPYTLVCDHIPDCQDDTDETFCVFPPCSFPMHMRCLYRHECVRRVDRCDGIPHCIDKSDETDCRQTSKFDHRKDPGKPPFIIDMERVHGYPVLKPLGDPAFSQCPDTHVQCPRDQNCLPVNMRCNGVFDCSHREDELKCETYTCPNFYRCRGSLVCVHPVDLCDNTVHCPLHDDERFCHLTCSESCTCLGHSMKCHKLFDAHKFPLMKYLDGRGSGMTVRDVANNSLLVYLNLASCQIKTFENTTLPNLHILDLSDNQLEVLTISDMLLVPKVKKLSVSGNPISSLFLESQTTNHSLEELDVSYGNFRGFNPQMLTSLNALQVLNLSHNSIQHMQDGGLQSLPKTLRVLDTSGCPIKTFPRNLFEGLNDLQSVYADNYKLCCPSIFPRKFVRDNCHAPFNEVSSCDDLLRSNIYRVPLFILAVLSLLGNCISFTARMALKRSKTVSGFSVFVLHLCFSDFLMGVYLVFIGVADRVYQGRYLWQDTSWRHSVACKLAGFVSMMSSEVSAFIICLITLDRFIVLRFPFSTFRFGYSSAQIISVAVWIIGFALATIPLLPVTSHWQFYSQTGICIPLPVTRKEFSGHEYAFGVMITLNFAIFLMIATGQSFVYVTIQSSKMSESETSRKSQDATIARRLITIVVSDFLCWFPIGLLGLLAASGTPIPGEVNVAMAIFVLPLNSALNPFLYTLNMIQEYTAKRKEDKLLRKILLQKDTFVDNVNSK